MPVASAIPAGFRAFMDEGPERPRATDHSYPRLEEPLVSAPTRRPRHRPLAGAILGGLALTLLSSSPASAQRPRADDVSGTWEIAIVDPDEGDRAGRLSLVDRSGLLTGRVAWDDGSALDVSGRLRDGAVELQVATFTGVPLRLQGSVSEDGTEMSGEHGDSGAWMAFLDARPASEPVARSPGPAGPSPDDRRVAGDPEVGVRDPGSDLVRRPADPTPLSRRPVEEQRPRIDAPDLEGGAEQAVSNFADDLADGAPIEAATQSFASDAVEVAAQETGRRAADAVADIASDRLARGVGGATRGAVGAGLREALDLEGSSDDTPLEAASEALADAAVAMAAAEAHREVSEAASDVVKEEVADKVGRAAGGVLGGALENAVEGGGLLGGLFGRGGDDDPDEEDGPAPGLLSGRWRFAVIESRGEQVLTHTGTLDLSEDDGDVDATVRWTDSAPSFLGGRAFSGERDGIRLSIRADESGPLLSGVVDSTGRRMGGYVSSNGYLGLWQATR